MKEITLDECIEKLKKNKDFIEGNKIHKEKYNLYENILNYLNELKKLVKED